MKVIPATAAVEITISQEQYLFHLLNSKNAAINGMFMGA